MCAMANETPTGTFRDLPVGAVFRVCWGYDIFRKVDATDHNAETMDGTGYNIQWFTQIRQDWNIEEAAK